MGDESSDEQYNETIKASKLSDWRARRGVVCGQQTKMNKYIDTNFAKMTTSDFEARLSLLEMHYQKFDKIQIKLECADEAELSGDKREQFEELYCTLKGKIFEGIARENPRSTVRNESVDASMLPQFSRQKNKSLPKLKLSTFSGEYIDWPDFFSMFSTLVHEDPDLSKSEKFQYLRSCLAPKALKTIESLGELGTNYDAAIQLMKRRYDNKRLIFQGHISKIINFPPITKSSVSQLRSLSDTVQSNIRALLKSGSEKEIFENLIIYLISNKFDTFTQNKWEEEASLSERTTWEDFSLFIERRCTVLENSEYKKTAVNSDADNKKQKGVSLAAANPQSSCIFCKASDHLIHYCKHFLDLQPNSRFNEIKRLKLCINCLKPGHIVKDCSSSKCRKCSQKHNTLLHLENNSNHFIHNKQVSSQAEKLETTAAAAAENSLTNSTKTSLAVQNNSSIKPSVSKHVFLATVLLHVKNAYGTYISCRAILDSASQIHFITEKLVQQLQLKKFKVITPIMGIGQNSVNAKYCTNITIKSRLTDYTSSLEAIVLPQIIDHQPSKYVAVNNLTIPNHILNKLADPSFFKPQKIDLLIGADRFFELLSSGQIRLGDNQPILQNTVLGWIVVGSMADNSSLSSCIVSKNMQNNENLDSILKDFWAIENHDSPTSSPTINEIECEKDFVQNHKRAACGRYIVSLPFRENPAKLGNSLDIALKRFYNLEYKISKSPNFDDYNNFMEEYIKLNHMQQINFDEIPKHHYFIPHHCVFKPTSSTTKLRVVFDASCKSSSGFSLNDILRVGPVIQNDLFTILIRFRTFRYAMTADITKMYRQVMVTDSDSFMQCILWRKSKDEKVQAYRLLTVTYGTAPASFLSTRCLKQLVIDEASFFSIGLKTLETDFYVDDMLTGANTLNEALKLQKEVIEILNRGGFQLHKWCSNTDEILNEIPENCREQFIDINGKSVIKTLGLLWKPRDDVFCFSCNVSGAVQTTTKREVLSIIAKIFDPLGLIGPVILMAKLFMKQIYLAKIDWDEILPADLIIEWNNFYNTLQQINSIQIPRYIFIFITNIQLHGFADASTKAYGACVYVRCIDNSGNISVNVLASKSRVTPIDSKNLTIPRLELCAALLLAEFITRIATSLDIKISKIVCWSDSKITLCRIASNSSNYTVFVYNRIAKIQKLSSNFDWRYIQTDINPADAISRGLYPAQLVDSKLWWNGPDFLHKDYSESADIDLTIDDPEIKKTKISIVACSSEDLYTTCKFHNSFRSTQNVFAYIYRFFNNLKLKKIKAEIVIGPLTTSELEFALKSIIKMIQKHEFTKEYNQLLKKRLIDSKSILYNLTPFLDDFGLIRVGGRLKHTDLDFEAKHQIVLPKSHLFTKSLIKFYHFRNLHSGCQTLLSIIRTRFWPIGGKNIVKDVISKCLRCFRQRPIVMQQLMGDLPKDRVRPSRPFLRTGIDFCGPFYITHLVRGRAPTKSYISLFICFTTKAVHLEVVSNLSSEAFLSSLRRFVSRRGTPEIIFSDNATNFVGANNKLKELRQLFNNEFHIQAVQEYCATDGLQWKFIPPRSPHFGGLWEASIKLIKGYLNRIGSAETFTLEEIQTIVCQVEAMVNSRPISPLSNDPHDMESLTPAHFLVGHSLAAIPEPSLSEENYNRLTRWQKTTFFVNRLWKHWNRDYLQSIQNRNKWKSPQINIEIGSMVIIKDENMPPTKWHLGRIVNVIKGADGHVRVATIKTARGDIQRAIAKLCVLPIETDTN